MWFYCNTILSLSNEIIQAKVTQADFIMHYINEGHWARINLGTGSFSCHMVQLTILENSRIHRRYNVIKPKFH